jgi:Xaa-Pro aminopeptidase
MNSPASNACENQWSQFFGSNKLRRLTLMKQIRRFSLSALLIVAGTTFGGDTKSEADASAPAVATAKRTSGRSVGTALAHMGINASEFQARRQSAMKAASDGIVLLHSFSAPKSWSDSGFQQDSNFYYFTGLENLHNAILAIDGTMKEAWLFVMPPTEREQRRFSKVLTGWDSAYLSPGKETEQLLAIDHVVAWDEFSNLIDSRRKTNPKIVLYLDQSGQEKMVADVSNPPTLAPIENPYLLWSAAIRAKWADANIADGAPLLQSIRAIKSSAEIALMEKAARYTDAGFRAAMAAIGPGRTSRQIEGAAIEGALRAGADGISWPEVKCGPVSSRTVFQKFYDYHLLNRTVQAGETVLMDLGFSCEHYRGDVGRTLPVSGHFTSEQREVVDLMNGAYQSALRTLHDGVSADEVVQAAARYVEEHRQELHSELARRAALELLKPTTWVIYTHGLDMVEIYPPKEFHTGNTVAIGPDFDVDGQGFYQEDVALIKADGYLLINPALPYSPADIEQTMSRLKQSQQRQAPP